MFKHFENHFQHHFDEMHKISLNDLFTQEPNRYTNYQQNAAGLTLDFLKFRKYQCHQHWQQSVP